MTSELDDIEGDYGSWEYSIFGALEEERRLCPRQLPKEVWPDWSAGVPTFFRQHLEVAGCRRGRVTYFPVRRAFEVDLDWGVAYQLSELKKHYGWLPSTRSSQWAGVYRIYVRDRTIGRLLGPDATGTLYLGMAGEGPKSWSIMRSRVMSAAKRDHHATMRWWYDQALSATIPWDTVLIEWAYTNPFVDHLGDKQPNARRAERWLLQSYRDTYGELPPMNEKG